MNCINISFKINFLIYLENYSKVEHFITAAIALAVSVSFTVSATFTASTIAIASSLITMATRRTNVVVPASTAANTRLGFQAPQVPS